MGCPTVKIKPQSQEQGEYVVINEEDFDKEKHEIYVEVEGEVPNSFKKPARKQG